MSLLNRVSNQEVFDFLKTLTIKYSYFAKKIRESSIRQNLNKLAPETVNPYVIHLAGEYVLDPRTFPTPDSIKDEGGGIWFKGYRLTKDEKVNPYKNYWKRDGQILRRLSRELISKVVNPKAVELYELQPLIMEGIIDPVTGQSLNQEYRASQNLYDRDGNLAYEFPNHKVFVDGIYDEMMYITSLDTGTTIPFTLESFYEDCALAAGLPITSVHKKTLEAYRVPNRYFELLCNRYPKQVDLIKAIVYRVPTREISSLASMKEINYHLSELFKAGTITRAYYEDLKYRFKTQEELLEVLGQDIEGLRYTDGSDFSQISLSEARRTRIAKAENLTLLGYNTARLDSTERTSMTEHVVKTLDIIRRRWAVDEFNFEHNYAPVLWTLIWTVLPVACIAKRYANVKTPYVCLDHMWDYLNSKGLKSYKGYLTEKQTWFLYKNINYLLQHAGQQKVLDILIDNILTDYGLTLKAKTVLLDTSKSLQTSSKPSLPTHQCESCSRHNVTCFKNITTYTCDDWLGTTTLCKAEPVILTEAFAGATKEKIIRGLKKSFGYSSADASIEDLEERLEQKYQRSFIWRDEDIEAIKDDLNRDQMVDQSGKIETMEEILDIEHAGGQEPVVNSDIVQEQRVELRNMRGTYVPTKLLEMTKSQTNARFSPLFNKFLTETLYRFATNIKKNSPTGTIEHEKTKLAYSFTTTEGASSYNFNFKEMLAITYLGFTRENLIDTLIDELHWKRDENNRIIYSEQGNPVLDYKEDDPNAPEPHEQHRLINMLEQYDYNFAIPTQMRLVTAFKFGKPVLQEELVKAYKNLPADPDAEEFSFLHDVDINNDGEKKAGRENISNKHDGIITRIVDIRDTKYAIALIDLPALEDREEVGHAKETMWDDYQLIIDGQPKQILILGEYLPEKSSEGILLKYYENRGEIPIIPKYFRWYYLHMNPEFEKTKDADYMESVKKGVKVCRKYNDGTYYIAEIPDVAEKDKNQAFKEAEGEVRKIQTAYNYVDETTKEEYRIFHMSEFIDVRDLLDRWVDVMGQIYDQATIARYIDSMFTILEDVYSYAASRNTVRSHLACNEFLDRVLVRWKNIQFDLVEPTLKTHDVRSYENDALESGYPKDTVRGRVAYYEDWIGDDRELRASLKIIENMSSGIGWNEFNTTALKQLTSGCTIPYTQEILSKNQYNKIKQLVLQLSSYRITIVDEAENGVECICVGNIVEDQLIDQIETEERIFFDPVGDSVFSPRIGTQNELLDESKGDILVRTSDLRRLQDKTYYRLVPVEVPHGSGYPVESPNHIIRLDDISQLSRLKDPGDVPDHSNLLVSKKQEMIGINGFELWDFYYKTLDTVAIEGKDYYFWNEVVGEYNKSDVQVGDSVRGLFELVKVNELLPEFPCYEKVNLYSLLGITPSEDGSLPPLTIVRDEHYDWYYRLGTIIDSSVDYPCGNTGTESFKGVDYEVQVSEDRFDLKNDFSNEDNAKIFGCPVYRINIPTKPVIWGDPIKSFALEQALAMQACGDLVVTESLEPSICMTVIKDAEDEEEEQLHPTEPVVPNKKDINWPGSDKTPASSAEYDAYNNAWNLK